jgi:hypothetical protein
MSFYPAANENYGFMENMVAKYNIVKAVLQRNNPIANMLKQAQYMLVVLFTIRQKLNIVKQRVNHMKYRLHQMEQLIQQNSSYKYTKGSTINQIR